MKILMVSDVYFPRINGVSTSIQTFRRELAALGYTVHLVAPEYGAPSEDETGIFRVPARGVPLDPEDRLMKWGAALGLLPRLREEGYDIVHIQTPFIAHYLGRRFADALGVPKVETYHTFFEEYFYHYIPFLPKVWLKAAARRLSRRQCNALDALVAPSRAMLEVLRAYGVTAPAEIIPTGLEPESFVPGDGAAFRARHGIAPGRPVLVHVGRVAFEKNIGFLLDVTVRVKETVPDVLFLVAGEGPALPALKRRAEELGLRDNTLFVGYLDRHRELPDCYRAGDLFVFASRTETQGLVLLEAMAQGVPLVSVAEMGAADVLRNGQGVLVAEHEVEDFSAKVLRLLGDEPERSLLGALGREYAARWSATEMAEKLAAAFAGIVAARGAAARPCGNAVCLGEE